MTKLIFRTQYLLVLGLLALSACATASQGINQKITVNSTPQSAEVVTSHGYGCDETPCSFYVPRNSSFEMKISKPGFSTKKVKVKTMLSSVGTARSLGSVVLGGVIAGGYDGSNSLDIEFISFSTGGDAIDFGNLTVQRWSLGGASDSHGGLGGF